MKALFDKYSTNGLMNHEQFKEAFIEFTCMFPTQDDFKKELIQSIKGRIRFYKDNDRLDNASTLEILLNDIINEQLLDFMK